MNILYIRLSQKENDVSGSLLKLSSIHVHSGVWRLCTIATQTTYVVSVICPVSSYTMLLLQVQRTKGVGSGFLLNIFHSVWDILVKFLGVLETRWDTFRNRDITEFAKMHSGRSIYFTDLTSYLRTFTFQILTLSRAHGDELSPLPRATFQIWRPITESPLILVMSYLRNSTFCIGVWWKVPHWWPAAQCYWLHKRGKKPNLSISQYHIRFLGNFKG